MTRASSRIVPTCPAVFAAALKVVGAMSLVADRDDQLGGRAVPRLMPHTFSSITGALWPTQPRNGRGVPRARSHQRWPRASPRRGPDRGYRTIAREGRRELLDVLPGARRPELWRARPVEGPRIRHCKVHRGRSARQSQPRPPRSTPRPRTAAGDSGFTKDLASAAVARPAAAVVSVMINAR